MKILMLTDRMEAGGVETHIMQLILELQKMGYGVSLLSGGGKLADQLEQMGIPQYRVSLPTHAPVRLLYLRRYLHKLVASQGFSILHAHSRITALLIRGCEKLGAGEIVTVHAHFRTNPILKKLCYWGNYTIAVSEDLRTYVCRSYGVPYERVRVIANGIDLSRFSPAPPTPPTPEKPMRVLFASRMDKDCSLGAQLLCELAPALCTRFPKLEITLAGDGSAAASVGQAASRANRLLGYQAVRAVGWVDDMPALLRGQDIFVGVSRAALEAAAVGCAVVLCGNEGYLGILTEANFNHAALSNFCARGCKKPQKSDLERDLTALLEDPSLRLQATRCAVLVRQDFDVAAICRETLALYLRARPMPRKRSVVLGGYFGCGNTGDDAILLGLLEELRTLHATLGITLLSGNPARDRVRFGIPCVNRYAPLSIARALLRADALLFGGGSLLQNATSNRSLLYYLLLLHLARCLRRPILFSSAGIGPLSDEKALMCVKNALTHCKYVSLRDDASKRLLTLAGMHADALHKSADPALLMPLPPKTRGLAILQDDALLPNTRRLVVVLKGGASCANTRRLLLTAVRLVCQSHELLPLFVIMDQQCDAQDTQQAARACKGRAISLCEPADACAVFASAKAVISMRLHALILSCAVGSVAIGVPAHEKDTKIEEFAKISGQDCIPLHALCVATLVERIEAAIANRHTLRPILLDSAADLQKKARKDLANITKMIYNIR